MEAINNLWNYCVQKLSFSSKNQQIQSSSDIIQDEQFNISIDQALGISTSLDQKSRPSIFSSSSSVIPYVKDLIYIEKIFRLLRTKSNEIISEREQIPRLAPYLDDDKKKFNRLNIDHVYLCKRENIFYIKDFPMAKLHTEHTDTIFCSKNTCMLASFHENHSRVDQGIYKKGQAEKVYKECQEYQPNRQIKFSDAQIVIDELKKEKYQLLDNNCNHSSKKIINKLDLQFTDQNKLESL